MDAAIATLILVRDDEWAKGAHFWGEGFFTIEGLFGQVSAHLAQHTVQMNQGAESAVVAAPVGTSILWETEDHP